MKAIRTLLECKNKDGAVYFRKIYPTKTEALSEGRWYVRNGLASSYKITPNFTGNE